MWGGAPEVIARATEVWDGRGRDWRTLSFSVGGGAWLGSMVRSSFRKARCGIRMINRRRLASVAATSLSK
jgi:hypothetical protein